MTGKIINLRHARKQKQRAEKETKAEENRTKFGRTGAQKNEDNVTKLKAKNHLDGHKLADHKLDGETQDD